MRFTVEELAEKVLEACRENRLLCLGDYRDFMDKVLFENGVPADQLLDMRAAVGAFLTDQRQTEFLSHFTVTQGNPLGSRKKRPRRSRRRPTTFADTMEGVALDVVALHHVEEKLQEEASA